LDVLNIFTLASYNSEMYSTVRCTQEILDTTQENKITIVAAFSGYQVHSYDEIKLHKIIISHCPKFNKYMDNEQVVVHGREIYSHLEVKSHFI